MWCLRGVVPVSIRSMKPDQFRPLRVQHPDALAQCTRCRATFSIDLVDVITGFSKVHKPASDPRWADEPCGGEVKLFQEIRSE